MKKKQIIIDLHHNISNEVGEKMMKTIRKTLNEKGFIVFYDYIKLI